MPIYEYTCKNCGHSEDVLQKMSDPPLKKCPACGKTGFTKLVSAAGFQLKGNGWYQSDFKDKPLKPKEAKPEATKKSVSSDGDKSS